MQINGFNHITVAQAKNGFSIVVCPDLRNLFSCTAGGFLMIIVGTDQRLSL